MRCVLHVGTEKTITFTDYVWDCLKSFVNFHEQAEVPEEYWDGYDTLRDVWWTRSICCLINNFKIFWIWNLNSSLLLMIWLCMFVMPFQNLLKLVVVKTTAQIHHAYSTKSPDMQIHDLILWKIFAIHLLLLFITCWRCSLMSPEMSSRSPCACDESRQSYWCHSFQRSDETLLDWYWWRSIWSFLYAICDR